MKTVCNELEDVKHKAYEIGIQLGIPHSKMVVFEKEGRPLSSGIDYWLCGNVPNAPITWEYVVTALESKQVGEMGCAKLIKQKYCYQYEGQSSCIILLNHSNNVARHVLIMSMFMHR